MAGQRAVDRDDLPVGVDGHELEASEVQQQRAGQPRVASPLGFVAALFVIERDQQRLLSKDQSHSVKIAERVACR